MSLPNFIIAGPPKCGTTSVFEWLSKHPETHPSTVKETYFFYDHLKPDSGLLNYHAHGIHTYERLFEGWNGQKIIFEASPGYIYSQNIFKGLKELNISPKILFIYRDPEDRLFSEYRFQRYKTKRTRLSFKDFIGYHDHTFCNSIELNRGKYVMFLREWIKYVPSDHIQIYLFQDLVRDPRKLMVSLASFLEIDQTFFAKTEFTSTNETYNLRSKPLHDSALHFQKFIPESIRKPLANAYFKFNKSVIPEKSAEEENIIHELNKYYAESVEEFNDEFDHLIVKV